MPSSRHARMTRMAISPRLAIKILLKSFRFIAATSPNRQEWLAGADDLALFDIDTGDATRDGGDDVVLHLHRLEHRNHIAKLHLVPHLDWHLDDQPLHRRDHGAFARPGRWRRRRRDRCSAGRWRDSHAGAGDAHLEHLALDLRGRDGYRRGRL